jgi:hypothetical protein
MKKILYCILLSVMAGCAPMFNPESSTDETSRILIQCMNQESLKQNITLQLRFIKMKDIEVNNSESFSDIRAAWYNKDIPLEKVLRMATDITHMPGVLNVRLENHKGVIRQAL